MAATAGATVSQDKNRSRGPLVVFTLDGGRYALRLESVERVLPTVAVTPLPKAPAIVTGIINLAGRILPVLDIRRRFGLPPREPGLYDHLIVAHTARRTVTLAVDKSQGVLGIPAEAAVPREEILPRVEYLEGVVKLGGGLILIHDLETFLSLDEERSLAAALEGRES
ncbi:MAG: chemotaxis protein CheW [Desulfobacteraceae bacterium]|nr:chemotaxis protein CheW [Desulfobacteraceae bacterium]